MGTRSAASAERLTRRLRSPGATIQTLRSSTFIWLTAAWGTDVAAQLSDMGQLGILYVTGNVSGDHLDTARGHARLAKPYRFAELLRSLEIVLELIVTGHASTPFPDGLGVLPRAMADPMEPLHA